MVDGHHVDVDPDPLQVFAYPNPDTDATLCFNTDPRDCSVSLKGLGHEIEFKYVDENE
jgi:hypothetical protein